MMAEGVGVSVPVTEIESATGLSREVIRKWEIRYGFPIPERDRKGERLYPRDQVECLRLISRLLDAGMRPSKVVGLDRATLEKLTAEVSLSEMSVLNSFPSELFRELKSGEPSRVFKLLQAEMHRQGLLAFAQKTIPHLNNLVGDAWLRGDLRVYEEHLYAQVIQDLLQTAVSGLSVVEGGPRVLLTTMPGEIHQLGLMLARTVLTLNGAECIMLGAQTPIEEIAEAAEAFRTEIVGLSFSIAQPLRNTVRFLTELRAALPSDVRLWAGGMGVGRLNRKIEGVSLITNFETALQELRSFLRDRHAPVGLPFLDKGHSQG